MIVKKFVTELPSAGSLAQAINSGCHVRKNAASNRECKPLAGGFPGDRVKATVGCNKAAMRRYPTNFKLWKLSPTIHNTPKGENFVLYVPRFNR